MSNNDNSRLTNLRRRTFCKLAVSMLLAMLLLLFNSVFYKTIILMTLFGIWRNKLASRIAQNRRPWFKRSIWCILLISLWVAMPRWRTGCTDRVRLLYMDNAGNIKHPPLSQYLLNVLMPENEMVNFGLLGIRFSIIGDKTLHISPTLLKQANGTIHDGHTSDFLKPYFMGTSNPMSGIWAQVFNDCFGDNDRAAYLCKPTAHSSSFEYPLIVFCHGYLGNLRMYQGVLKGFDNAIVLSIPTHGIDGIFHITDINEIFTFYMPVLEKMGFNIDHGQIHLIGLSNGVSAIGSAMKSPHANDFKSMTAISGIPQHSCKISGKVNLIGGGKDTSSANVPGYCSMLKSMGIDAEMYFGKKENHFMFVSQSANILSFLKSRMQLKINDIDDPD